MMRKLQVVFAVCLTIATTAFGQTKKRWEEGPPWPGEVPGFVAPAAGEHPRLFFRKVDLEAMRERAKTPEGQAIVARLRALLTDGERMPTWYNGSLKAYAGNFPITEKEAWERVAKFGQPAEEVRKPDATKSGLDLDKELGGPVKAPNAVKKDEEEDKGESETPKKSAKEMPVGDTYTIGHAAGFGMLYQLTGEKKYADLGRKCMELALGGIRDKDDRYSFRAPGGALRAGPSLGVYAMAYDLCYDGWDEAFRTKVASEIANYNEGSWCSLPELARGARHEPGKNHWGGQVGGAALALLAVYGDKGVDNAKLDPLLKVNAEAMIRHLTEGYGDGGWYSEGQGPGGIASDTAFVPALQAWKVAGGKDFVTPRPHASGITLIKMYQLNARKGLPHYTFHVGDYGPSYGLEFFARAGMSRSGHFAQGFGVLDRKYVPAVLWVYENIVEPCEANGFLSTDGRKESREKYALKPGEKTWDALDYPHRAVLALINWPIGVKAQNPATVLPKLHKDTYRGYWCMRNRWQDEDDIIVSVKVDAKRASNVIWGPGGMRFMYGQLPGMTFTHKIEEENLFVVSNPKGQTYLAVDMTRRSGADLLMVVVGKSVPANPPKDLAGPKGESTKFYNFELSGQKVGLFTMQQSGDPVKVEKLGEGIRVGGANVTFDGQKIDIK